MNGDELFEELKDQVRELIRDICEYTTESDDSETSSSSLVNSQSIQNFMEPIFDDCDSVSVSIKCGRDFWGSTDFGRSTFVTVYLHPDIPPLKTSVCYHSLTPVYDFKSTISISNLSFVRIVPMIEVRDEANSELYGVAYICTQFTEQHDHDLVVVDGWVPILHPIGRVPCGSVLLSIIFRNSDDKSICSEEPLQLIRIRDEIIELKNGSTQTIPPQFQEEYTQIDNEELPPPVDDSPLKFLEEDTESVDEYQIDEVESEDEFHFQYQRTFFDDYF
jgi:hypothetical protein